MNMDGRFFTAQNKAFHYTQTKVSKNKSDSCVITNFAAFFICKANWNGVRDYCQRKYMQMASLKTLSQLEAVTNELKSRGFGESKKCEKSL